MPLLQLSALPTASQANNSEKGGLANSALTGEVSQRGNSTVYRIDKVCDG